MDLGKAVLNLSADPSELNAVLEATKKKAEGWGGAVGGVAKGAALAFAAVGTAALGIVGALTASATAVAHDAGEVAKLKRELGLTAEESSKLRYEGERMGLGVDDLSKSFGILSKSLESAHPSLAKYNIEVVKSKDGHIDMEATLGKVADRFKAMPDGVEKTALALDIFGRSGKDMIPLLNQGSDGLKRMGDEAARLGLVFDDKTLAAAKRLSLAQKDLKDNMEAVRNHISVAFLPVLAEWSGYLVSIASAVLPKVIAGLDLLSGGLRTAIGVVKDMIKAWKGDMAGGGDLLAGIIGPKAAEDFMVTVRNVALTFNHFYETVIKPALVWLGTDGRKIWDNIREKIADAWSKIEPKLIAFQEKLETLRTKFDALPEPVKRWAQETAVTAVVIKASGIDGIILDLGNSIGNLVSGIAGAGGLILAMRNAGLSVLAFLGGFAMLAVQIPTAIGLLIEMVRNSDSAGDALRKLGLVAGAMALGLAVVFLGPIALVGALFAGLVVFIGQHLDDLEASWTMLSLIFKLEFAKVVDFLQNAWQGFVAFIVGKINDLIGKVNDFIGVLNMMPGVHVPLISKIEIDLPNADNVNNALNEIARNRTSTVDVYEVFHPASQNVQAHASGTDHITRGPELFLAGEAGPERVTVTPLAQGIGRRDGGGDHDHNVNVFLDGKQLTAAVSRQIMRGAGLAGAPLG